MSLLSVRPFLMLTCSRRHTSVPVCLAFSFAMYLPLFSPTCPESKATLCAPGRQQRASKVLGGFVSITTSSSLRTAPTRGFKSFMLRLVDTFVVGVQSWMAANPDLPL